MGETSCCSLGNEADVIQAFYLTLKYLDDLFNIVTVDICFECTCMNVWSTEFILKNTNSINLIL